MALNVVRTGISKCLISTSFLGNGRTNGYTTNIALFEVYPIFEPPQSVYMQESRSPYPRLSKAPILLAIMEIQYQSPVSVTNASLKSLEKVFKDEFPSHQVLQHHNLLVQNNAGKTSISVKNIQDQGHLFVSSSKKHEFTVSSSMFNFKQHGEYSDWEEFKQMAMSVFERCLESTKATRITRVSLRYVNKIELPFEENFRRPVSDFFKTFIAHTGTLIDRPIAYNSVRFTHIDEPAFLSVNYAQELEVGPVEPSLNFLMDIDVLFTKDENMDIDFISAKLDELRAVKNEYFFETLTEYTLNILR